MNSSSGLDSGNSTGHGPGRLSSVADEWEATRAQTALATQIMRRDDDLPTIDAADIGVPGQANQRELNVSCAPGLALQQQFEHLHPEFIALHGIATGATRKLLAGLAGASNAAVHKLVIKRQGFGTALATLEYVDVPRLEGPPLRLYSTSGDAEPADRAAIARTLLGFSKLAVVMVGDLPGNAIDGAIAPFREAMINGPWPNRQLLLMPLTAGNSLAAYGATLALSTGVVVRTAPQVSRAAGAWDFIHGTWTRMQEGENLDGVSRPSTATRSRFIPPPRPSAERAMRPMPSVRQALTQIATPQNLLARYVQQLAQLPGVVSCCVFDVNTGLEVEFAGASPEADELAMHGKALLAGMSASSRALGMGHLLPEAAITFGSHHLLLRAVPGHPGLAMHAALDKAQANLMLVRLQVQRLDALLDAAQ